MASILGRAIPLFTRMFPKQAGPRGLQYTFPMSSATSWRIMLQLTSVGLDILNGVFIDNKNNSSGFLLTNTVTGQSIFVPANSQANISLITPQGYDNMEFIGETTGGVDVPVIFRNTEPISDTIYSTVAAGQIIGAVTVQGTVTALPNISQGVDALVQSITAGNTPQVLFATNAARKGLMIANPASGPTQNIGNVAPESLFIRFGANPSIAGNGTIEIAPGGYFNSLTTAVDTRAINILAATANHVFAAVQFQ